MKLLFSIISLVAAFISGMLLLYPWRELLYRGQIRSLQNRRDNVANDFKSSSISLAQKRIEMLNVERRSFGLKPISLDHKNEDVVEKVTDTYNDIIEAVRQHYNNHEDRDLRIYTAFFLILMLVTGLAALLIC